MPTLFASVTKKYFLALYVCASLAHRPEHNNNAYLPKVL